MSALYLGKPLLELLWRGFFATEEMKDAHHLVVRTMASKLIESTAARSSLACDPWYILRKGHMDQVDMEQKRIDRCKVRVELPLPSRSPQRIWHVEKR